MRIFTGNYENCKIGDLVSISGNKGKSVNFNGNAYTKLAPKKEFWKIWHDNIGILSEDENNKFYMQEFYKQVLLNLDPKEVLEDLEKFGKNVILLCYEENKDFCYRHLVATWLEKTMQIKVEEISIDENINIEILQRNQKYVEEFKEIMNQIDLENEKGDFEK